MNRLKRIVLVTFAAAISIGLVLPMSQVNAQGSASLGFPPTKDYNIEPGKSISDTLTITNRDREQTLNLSLRIVDFTYNDETGTPKLMLAEDAPQTTWSLKPFLKVPETVTIEPGSSQTLDMSVAIPQNHGAGSYYSAVVYSTSAPDGGNVGLSASGVTLIFTTIPGEVNQDLQLEKLGAFSRTKNKYSYFTTEQPDTIAYTLKNQGNVTESPVGSINLKHIFGKEITIQNINPNNSLALIGQTRRFDSCIKLKNQEVDFDGSRSEATTCASPGLWPGYYKVTLDAYYGQNGNMTQELNGKASFWYLPWWFILVSLIALALISYRIWRIVRYIKNRRRGANLTSKRSSFRRKK